jgi:methionine-rich copper-binding protein CopC
VARIDIDKETTTLKSFLRNAGVTSVALVAALAVATTAWGHAHPETLTPAKGAVLQSAPSAVDIVFVQEIQKTAGSYGITVQLDGGASVTSGAATIDAGNAAHLSIALTANLAAGRYVVNWHNVSSVDGDPAEGAFSFYVKTQPTAADIAKDADLAMIGQEEMGTPTAMPMEPTVIAPAPATSPVGAASPAASAPSAALPRTGDGGSRGGKHDGMILIVAMAAGVAAAVAGAATIAVRRER